MRFFTNILKQAILIQPLKRGIYNHAVNQQIILEGEKEVERLKQLIQQREYRKAINLADQIEIKYPEFFKAIFIYRGQAGFGLAEEMGLIDKDLSTENSNTPDFR